MRGADFDSAAAGVADVRLSLHEDVTELENEWREFEQRADCTVFQSFAWLSAWQVHIGSRKGVRPAIVIGRSAAGDILFLLPLAVERRGLLRVLTWLGAETSDYNAPLLAPDFPKAMEGRALASSWPRILARMQLEPRLRFDLVHFGRMPQRVGKQANPLLELRVTPHPSSAHLAHLTGDWETFYAKSRSPATRKRERRKRKHLEEIGQVSFVTPQSLDDRSRSFDTLVAQKTRSLAAMGVPNFFRRVGYAEFYRALAVDAGAHGIAHLSRLDVGAVPAAVSLGLTFRGTYYLVLSSYEDGELSRFSPGSAHLHEVIRHAIDSGCTAFDFTVGDEPYKCEWADHESALFDHVRAARAQGALVALPLLAAIRLKRSIKQTDVLWDAFSKSRALLARLMSPRSAKCRAGVDRASGLQ